MVIEADIHLASGRTLHAYDILARIGNSKRALAPQASLVAVRFWHHGIACNIRLAA